MRVTDDNLGAWLIKGNADRADLFSLSKVTRWCVQPSYRTALMRAGQPVLFWGSGSKRRDVAYGVWGLGRVTGPPADGAVPLDLDIWSADWVARSTLRLLPGLYDLEVLRQPQGSNPSYVTKEQLAIILGAR